MKLKIAALLAAVAIPALGWAASSTTNTKQCRSCPLSTSPLKR